MIPSVILNSVTALIALAALIARSHNSSLRILLRYFTALSNLFCAVTCLMVVITRLCGTVPSAVLVLKYMGTSAVTVTFLTVMLFLGPFVYNYKVLLTGSDLWLHLVCPLLAIISFLLWDKPEASFGIVFLGVLPVFLYAVNYLYHVLLITPEKRWEDFYGFNRHGKWLLSLIVMIMASFLISLVLWIL